jgi:hypothetical protein
MITEPPKSGSPAPTPTTFNSHKIIEDDRMVDFVARWGPFDHGDEYILPEFGIAPSIFYRRVLAHVQDTPFPAMGESDRQRVIGYCLAKLAALSLPDQPRAASRPLNS